MSYFCALLRPKFTNPDFLLVFHWRRDASRQKKSAARIIVDHSYDEHAIDAEK